MVQISYLFFINLKYNSKVIKKKVKGQLIRIRESLVDLNHPKIMGILNLTEDSFFDGSKYNSIKKALLQTQKMIEEGAFFIDIGVASSSPGKPLISSEDEKRIITPYLKELFKSFPKTYFSVDTYNSEVAKLSLDFGVSLINDISGGMIDQKMFSTISPYKIPYVMMHMKGIPEKMQKNINYEDIIKDITYFFNKQLSKAYSSGVHDIILDPGFGFGKNKKNNFALLKNLNHFKSMNCPLLIGLSRKSMIYKTLGVSPDQSLNGTTALHAWALDRGARILRVHDVKEAKECIDLWRELQ